MIKFGTSGFRGVLGDNFTKENLQRIAYGLVQLLKKDKQDSSVIYIGYDNRFMGKTFAMWVAEVLVAYDIKIKFFEKSMPTPVVAFMSKTSTFGIVLTASHNPYYYNGIKIFKNGGEIPDEYASKLEKIANSVKVNKIKTLSFQDGITFKKVEVVSSFESYVKSVISFLEKNEVTSFNPKILFNSMHGNTAIVINEICKKISFKNHEIMNESIDPYFEYKLPAPYLENLTGQAKRVKKEKFDLGIALDGDSDRITCIDKSGEIFDGNYILTLLFKYFVEAKKYKGGVVHNTAFTNLISILAKKVGCADYVAKVGFKNIAEVFDRTDAFLGGETNGVALKEHVKCKDGILGAFLLISLISYYKKSFKQILSSVEKELNYKSKVLEFAYPITLKKKEEINEKVFIKKELPKFNKNIINTSYGDGAKYIFDGGYWAMVRFSGNENVVRIFAEESDENLVLKNIEIIENFIGVKVRQ